MNDLKRERESGCCKLKKEALGSSLENSLWKRQWPCRKADYILHEYLATQPIYSTMFSSHLRWYSISSAIYSFRAGAQTESGRPANFKIWV